MSSVSRRIAARSPAPNERRRYVTDDVPAAALPYAQLESSKATLRHRSPALPPSRYRQLASRGITATAGNGLALRFQTRT